MKESEIKGHLEYLATKYLRDEIQNEFLTKLRAENAMLFGKYYVACLSIHSVATHTDGDSTLIKRLAYYCGT